MPQRRARVALPVAAAVVVAVSLTASIRWAPYAYAFVNPIAGWKKENRSWELDYWGVSAREGVRRLREAGYTPIFVQPGQQPGVPYGAYNGTVTTGGKSGIYVFVRWDRASRFGCDVIFTIKRDGNLLGEGALSASFIPVYAAADAIDIERSPAENVQRPGVRFIVTVRLPR